MINGINSPDAMYLRYKLWVLIAIGLFIIGLGAGLLVSTLETESIVDLFSEELSALDELGSILGPFQATTAVFIFLKNVSALMISFIFSPILGLMPVFALLFNGSLLSFIAVLVVQEESLGFLLAGILPHAVFELPAFIIGEAAALSFGGMSILALISRKRRVLLLPNLKQNFKYLLIAFALLVPAAIIETFITPLFLQ